MEGRVEERMREIERVEGRLREGMREMEGRVKEEKRETEGRVVKEMERRTVEIVREEVARMKEVEERGREDGVTNFPIEYTVRNVSALQAQDKEWRSPPFYSHRGGYKMCIGVWPNGACGEKGVITILYYVMRDANTEALKWPVTLRVDIYVMNQDTKQWEIYNDQTVKQDKPSHESVLSSWKYCFLNHSGFYRQQGNYQQHIPYASFVKDDCLQIKVLGFYVSYN